MTTDASEVTYRLPVNLGFVALAMRDESPDLIFYIDLMTGGIFSLLRPENWDWERIGEGFDHSIDCGFRNGPERFLGVDGLSTREKKTIIEEYAASLPDQVLAGRLRQASLAVKPFAFVLEALRDLPAGICAWRAHLERACLEAAAEFLQSHEISSQPERNLECDGVSENSLLVN